MYTLRMLSWIVENHCKPISWEATERFLKYIIKIFKNSCRAQAQIAENVEAASETM